MSPRLAKIFVLAVLFSGPFSNHFAAAQQMPEDGRGQGLFDKKWHAERRAALMDTFLAKHQSQDAVIILRGAGDQDDYREFRQDNNFWYFTGITTPNAVYVCVPQTREEFLLLPLVNPQMERWLGDMIDPAEGRKLTTIAKVTKLSKSGKGKWGNLEALLDKLKQDHPVFYVQQEPAENWMMSRDNLHSAERAVKGDPFDERLTRGKQFASKLNQRYQVEVEDISPLIDYLRLVKTAPEIAAMRRAAEISGIGHTEVMATANAGEYEWQLAARMTGAFLENGAMGAAYLAIVGSGPNACILHYPAANRQLEGQDTVMIDFGAEFNHYVADISRTWPVGEKFSPRAREVYQAVYDAQEAAFKECKPGSTLSRVHRAAQKVLNERGFGFMWHGTSHWLGMSTHDVGASIPFEPGVVFTVEPGIYLPEEGLGVRIEDIVVITEDGYELLSSSIPRSIAQIEALRAQALLQN
jgi:Xaa-Pro aminopeptidase